VDRAAFRAFLLRQGVTPEGRLADWVNPDGETAATRVSESEPSKAKPGAAIDIETLSPGHPEENAEAIKRAIEIEREWKGSGKKPNRIAACREAVRECFPGHHDREGKAKSLAAGVRALKNK
jgi:hypothetical protein